MRVRIFMSTWLRVNQCAKKQPKKIWNVSHSLSSSFPSWTLHLQRWHLSGAGTQRSHRQDSLISCSKGTVFLSRVSRVKALPEIWVTDERSFTRGLNTDWNVSGRPVRVIILSAYSLIRLFQIRIPKVDSFLGDFITIKFFYGCLSSVSVSQQTSFSYGERHVYFFKSWYAYSWYSGIVLVDCNQVSLLEYGT